MAARIHTPLDFADFADLISGADGCRDWRTQTRREAAILLSKPDGSPGRDGRRHGLLLSWATNGAELFYLSNSG